ncbi:hypothetical protein K9B32_28700 [Rhizobium sp. 3T7]|uniref:thermonuclease family protein n=1 Tax=Rhizobium sp. 3T7 TaxID=2874922 RepID=UPI001CCF0417|nr:hypothetical protein [Rhizobium sp. 3T7]MBZ9794019.1 hypothetical protein [Rhizobium sp. 3T7]
MNATLATTRLSAWQRTFLADILSRLAWYGSNTRLSEKPRRELEEIVGSSADEGHPVHPPQPTGDLTDKGSAALIVVLLTYAAMQMLPWSSQFEIPERIYASTVDQQTFSVTDGDTIRVNVEASGTRLVSFNTPETFTPQCDRERKLGNRASDRLAEIVSKSSLKLTKVRCPCAPRH